VHALSRLQDLKGIHLDAIGDGPDLENCKALARSLKVDDRITFHGRVPHSALESFFVSSDVFVHPTFRESGGVVTFEAMGYGLPLICADYGAPGYYVNDNFGIRVSVESRDGFIAGIASAIRQLYDSPERAAMMGRNARTEILQKHLWSARLESFSSIYEKVISERKDAR
jgi:glycosyltransferase involved in cell wall biosynthesis